MASAVLLIFSIGFYFLPSFIGWNRKRVDWIIAINFFLGWTVVGWLVALGLACTADKTDQSPITTYTPKADDNLDKIKKLKRLLDSGAITQREFDIEKKKLLGNSPLTTEWKIKS